MDTMPTQWIMFGGVIVLAALALGAWFFAKKRKQSHRLQQRFGAEYGRTVDALGGRTKAESDLKAREKRVERLTLTPLASAEAARFSQAWNALQGRFVDNPKRVVVQADHLVRELMLKRGNPWAILSAGRAISRLITPPLSNSTGRPGDSAAR